MLERSGLLLLLFYVGAHLWYCRSILQLSFRLTEQPASGKRLWGCAVLLFGLNTSYFALCSALGLGLLKNFALFWLVFYWEERFLFRVPPSAARFLTLHVVLCTLSNILFYYGLLSLLIDQPLAYFSNILQPMDYRKVLALAVSYLSASVIFCVESLARRTVLLKRLIASMGQLKFLLASMAALYVYLLFQGILYGSLGNSLPEKLWSLMGCLYISVGFLFAARYAMRLSYFYHLDQKNLTLQTQLDRQRRDVSDLIDTADLDTLTKIRSRAAGEKELGRWMADGQGFVLCLMDLDSLKFVNDRIGHQYGDQYLCRVVEIVRGHCRQDRDLLWRGGGDEFLLAYAGLSEEEARRRMGRIADQVRQEGIARQMPMRISYGVETWDQESDYPALFERVDGQMYAMKREHKRQMAQFMRE